MSGPAIIRDPQREGRFVASECRLDDSGWCHARGHWRERRLKGDLHRESESLSWAPTVPLRIQWLDADPEALEMAA
jgi:hypothetical protein